MSAEFPNPSLVRIAGLEPISDLFNAVICDLWGVVHDGVSVFAEAVDCLHRLRKTGKPVILLSNSPRPSSLVVKQITDLGVPESSHDHVITSGDLTRRHVIDHFEGETFFHLGPPRDEATISNLPLHRTDDPANASIVICTGLMPGHESDVAWHNPLLDSFHAHDCLMVCANPDRIVELGRRRVPCAGALAEHYEAKGGAVVWLGKPYDAPYEACLAWLAHQRRPVATHRILAIGDSLVTDMAGAIDHGLQSLFITDGIHREELAEARQRHLTPEAYLAHQKLAVNYLDSRLRWSV